MPKSQLESDIEKATSEYNVHEDWQLIMDLCDRIKMSPNAPKESLKCIMKRINHQVPHVAMQALTLLEACVSNCGKPFHLEISSRDWTKNAKSVITEGHTKVSEKICELIEKWADDFKEDPQLNLIVQFYKKLKSDGTGFNFEKSETAKADKTSSNPRKKTTEDEVNFKEDLDLAIAMSLQEAESAKAPTASGSLYPSITSSVPPSHYQEDRELCKVKALYDFEAAEDNEMTFKAGEMFSVLDNSDQNWWKGRNERGVGLFPSNFVTTDLSDPKQEKKKVRFADSENAEQEQSKRIVIKPKTIINEEHLDLTLSMLKNASPTEIDDEEETISAMEESSREMGASIEKKILESDRHKDDLNDLNEKFLQALSMYQQMMKEPVNAAPPPQPVYQQVAPQQGILHQYQQHQQQQGYVYSPYQQQQQQQQQVDPQYAAQSQGYLPQQPMSMQMDKSYLYHGKPILSQSQPSSLPPMPNNLNQLPSLTQQPASLPLMQSSSHNNMPNPVDGYGQSQPIQQYSQAPPVHSQQQAYSQASYGQPQQQYDQGQYYSHENIHYGTQQVNEYSNYGYNVSQNTPQSYQQAQVYQ